jgi:hypothetical protein
MGKWHDTYTLPEVAQVVDGYEKRIAELEAEREWVSVTVEPVEDGMYWVHDPAAFSGTGWSGHWVFENGSWGSAPKFETPRVPPKGAYYLKIPDFNPPTKSLPSHAATNTPS